MYKNYTTLLFILLISLSWAQAPKKLNPSEIHNEIKKLNFLGSVLYLAAHPDDENTRLISYLSNHLHARTAYLSLTRGDGGQNLIGSELREQLGVLRTQELLAARRIDGGEQYFTRANDFGYSKHPDETLAIWNKEKVLSDVIRVIRQFKPDIIVNRFDHRSPGKTHGHHTTSAMLGLEAFDLANNSAVYPNQAKELGTWQPKRIFFNTSWWFYGSQEKFKEADKSNMITADIGVYYPSKGLSNNEIAALSRSQHKCQGFGSTGNRGEQLEYLELLKGDYPKNNNLFEGINTSWSRVKGGEVIGAILNKIETNFNFSNPSTHLPELVKAYQLIQSLTDEYWKAEKTKEITFIIEQCSGLYLEAVASASNTNPGTSNELKIEAINRSVQNIVLNSINVLNQEFSQDLALNFNKKNTIDINYKLSETDRTNGPYWLNKEGSLGMYHVSNTKNIGLPETNKITKATFNLTVLGSPISIQKDIIYKYTDPAKGEIYEPFYILPEVTSSIKEDVYIFNNNAPKKVSVEVLANKENINGVLQLKVPNGWSVSPEKVDLNITNKGMQKTVEFLVTPSKNQSEGTIESVFLYNNKSYNKELVYIDYDHIPKQAVLLDSKAKVVKLDITTKGKLIAYIKGSGDVTVESLEHIGYTVEELTLSNINNISLLEKYDAIVVGIRAYNVLENLTHKQDILFDYVKNGGNMVVQYNTRHRLKTDKLAPYGITLSRDRVTDEHAGVTFLAKNHEVLNYPNKITQKDFNGWVQERGLYFPNEWAKEFTPILSMHDKGESKKDGSLLIAKYGKGNYVYTGLSFFREFPAGVPGAYRLFANILSLGKNGK